MTTKTKHDLRYYVLRAVKDFKTLIIYFDVTRPQYESTFKTDGKFDVKKLESILKYLNRGTSRLTKDELPRYNKLSRAVNLTFGIPRELINKVMGEHVDENGRHHRIPSSTIIKSFIDKEFIRVEKNGAKVRKDKKSGTYKCVCYWHRKYFLYDRKYWHRLLADDRYKDINTFPHASERVKRIIKEWSKSIVKNDSKSAVKNVSNAVETPQTKILNSEISQSETNNVPSRFRQWVKNMAVANGFVKEMGMFDKLADYQVMEVRDTMKKAIERDDVSILDNIGLRYEKGIVELMQHVWYRHKKRMKARQSEEVA